MLLELGDYLLAFCLSWHAQSVGRNGGVIKKMLG